MKYMLLIATDPELEAANGVVYTDTMMKDYAEFTQRIVASGEIVSGDRLYGVDNATTVRVRNGSKTVTDGPFAETKEQLGGFYIVDVASLDRALELAAEIPGAKWGGVEVRPIFEMA
jgi:hypothetical protein